MIGLLESLTLRKKTYYPLWSKQYLMSSGQALHRLLPDRMLAHRSSQPFLWSSRNTLLVWYLLYLQCHRFGSCTDLAATICASDDIFSCISSDLYVDRYAASFSDWGWAPKPLLHLFMLRKTCQLTSEEALSCLGRCG